MLVHKWSPFTEGNETPKKEADLPDDRFKKQRNLTYVGCLGWI